LMKVQIPAWSVLSRVSHFSRQTPNGPRKQKCANDGFRSGLPV